MALLPKNICLGRDGRIAIMKKVPKDLWEHPHYKGKAKVVERSTGVTDEASGIEIAKAMLTELERQFAQCREDLRIAPDKSVPGDEGLPKKKKTGMAPKARAGADSAGDQARRDILAAAMIEFSEKGWHGARVDNIAAQTRTTKPMIYYYFGSKEKLYAAVMVEAYGGMRDLEQGLHLNALPPEEAMRRLVEATFDHHAAHPEYVRLIAAENME
ncbi:MAG TPA: TetR/AcrR family transcriptional regulator, partial [Telmatospirillum sp.]|nr:TetR/AcrR family transcriptional regulator [Telmatospirillum sp.]